MPPVCQRMPPSSATQASACREPSSRGSSGAWASRIAAPSGVSGGNRPGPGVAGEVGDGGLDAAGAPGMLPAGRLTIAGVTGKPRVSRKARASGKQRARAARADPGMRHGQRGEQSPGHQHRVVSARCPLQDQAEQLVAEVGVAPRVARCHGRQAQSLLGALEGVPGPRVGRVVSRGRPVRRHGGQPGGVGGQLANGDLAVPAGRQPAADRVIQAQRAVGGQGRQQGGGHGLGDRADLEPPIGGQVARAGGDVAAVRVDGRGGDAVAREPGAERLGQRLGGLAAPGHRRSGSSGCSLPPSVLSVLVPAPVSGAVSISVRAR